MNIDALNGLGTSSIVSDTNMTGSRASDQIESSKDGTFGEMLEDAIESVNDQMLQSNEMIKKMASGEDVDIADTMIAVTKAGISFRMLLQVRNKALSAYEEIMRMSV